MTHSYWEVLALYQPERRTDHKYLMYLPQPSGFIMVNETIDSDKTDQFYLVICHGGSWACWLLHKPFLGVMG